jgi:23S rRNA (uracil1939-C5)-methyltransferase
MGGMGDGIAHYDGKTVFIPYSCVGDTVRVSLKEESKETVRATLLEVLIPSPDRCTPACIHFGVCGGCALQQLSPDAYTAFKQEMLHHVVSSLGVSTAVIQPLIAIPPHSRRRADFHVAHKKGETTLGFLMEKQHSVINVTECPVMDERIVALLPMLREQLSEHKSITAIHMTALTMGMDMLLHTRQPLTVSARNAWEAFALRHSIVRLYEQPEGHPFSQKIYDSEQAIVSLSNINVALPVGAFLQASEEAQCAIAQCVTTWLEKCAHVADFYSGCGTYSFALAERTKARIAAYEGSVEMVSAMYNAVIANGLDMRMSATVRDLFTHPLKTDELAPFDGTVINPPRNGALPQMKHLAQSGIGKIVMVSCNPATFQRDAACLLKAGYQLCQVIPIDQFLWSRHLEIAALFERKH